MTNRDKLALSTVILLTLALGLAVGLAPLEKTRTLSLAGSSFLLALMGLALPWSR